MRELVLMHKQTGDLYLSKVQPQAICEDYGVLAYVIDVVETEGEMIVPTMEFKQQLIFLGWL